MKKLKVLFVLTAAVVLALAAFNLYTVQADGSVNWEGHGSDNLPCDGGHWVGTGMNDASAVVITVNGTDYPATHHGNGSWSADSSGLIDSTVTASVSWTGDADNPSLQLSHCLATPPPPPVCTTMTDWILVDTTGPILSSDGLSRTTTFTYKKYDASDNETVCDTRQEVQIDTYDPYCGADGLTHSYWSNEVPADVISPGECPVTPNPGSATVTVGTCYWDKETKTSYKDVTVVTDHAVVSIPGQGDFSDPLTVIKKLPSGNYSCTWNATAPYTGSGDCSFIISANCGPLSPPPPGDNNKLIPVTGADLTSGLALGLSSLVGLGLIIAAVLRKILNK